MVRSLFGTGAAQVSERDVRGGARGGNKGGMQCEGVMHLPRPKHPYHPPHPPPPPPLLLLHQDETVAKLEKLQVRFEGGGGEEE